MNAYSPEQKFEDGLMLKNSFPVLYDCLLCVKNVFFKAVQLFLFVYIHVL